MIFPRDLPKYETISFNTLFQWKNEVIIKSAEQLINCFSLWELESYCTYKWWVYDNSKTISKIYYIFILIFIFSFFYYTLPQINNSQLFQNIPTIILILLFSISIIIILWGIIFKYRIFNITDKWAEIASKILWYREFIKSCDYQRIQTMLKIDPLFINTAIAYSVAFGLDTDFLKKISPKEIDIDMFEWYYSKDVMKSYKTLKVLFNL